MAVHACNSAANPERIACLHLNTLTPDSLSPFPAVLLCSVGCKRACFLLYSKLVQIKDYCTHAG